MTNEEAKHKLKFLKKAYQKLIDEKVDSGKLVGDDVRGEWKAETLLDEAYKEMIEALEIAIKALEQQPSEDAVSREAIRQLICRNNDKYGYSDRMHELTEEIFALPSVQPQPKIGKWIITDKEHGRIWHCHCSNCKKDPQDCVGGTENWWLVRLPDYCPDCGAKMEVEE